MSYDITCLVWICYDILAETMVIMVIFCNLKMIELIQNLNKTAFRKKQWP